MNLLWKRVMFGFIVDLDLHNVLKRAVLFTPHSNNSIGS